MLLATQTAPPATIGGPKVIPLPALQSGEAQAALQGLKGEVNVGLTRTTASLRLEPARGIALPVAKKTLCELSSITTPPGAQTLSAPDGVWNTVDELTPSVGTPTTHP